MLVTVEDVAEALVLIRRAWSLFEGSLVRRMMVRGPLLISYLFVIVLPDMTTPDTVTSELIEPYMVRLE